MSRYSHEDYSMSIENGVVIKKFSEKHLAEREVRKISELEHKSLPKFIAKDNTLTYSLEGESLLSEALTKRLGVKEVIWIVHSILDLIEYLESKDLKLLFFDPSLFLVKPDDSSLLLIDYNLIIDKHVTADSHALFELESLFDYLPIEYSNNSEEPPELASVLYSIGVLLYRVFTGSNPFADSDATKTQYKHLSLVPPSPQDLSPLLARSLSDFIDKTLKKDPNSRYLSIHGFRSDFDSAIDLQLNNDLDKVIELGLDDLTDKFYLPKNVFFRTREIGEASRFLLNPTNRTFRGICLVNGREGTGKSKFLRNLVSSIDTSEYILGYGSFEEDDRVPYYGYKMILRRIATAIIGQSDQDIEAWRSDFQTNHPNELATIIDFDNEFGVLFREGDHTTNIDDQGTLLNRLIFSFRVLMESIEEYFAPVILCLDGIHKASRSSIRFLESLIGVSDLTSFRILVTFSNDHHNVALKSLIDSLFERSQRSNAVRLLTIELSNLSIDDIRDTLIDLNIEVSDELSGWLESKTGGRPKRFDNLIRGLIDQNRVRKTEDSRSWMIDLEGYDKLDEKQDEAMSSTALTSEESTLLRLLIFLGSRGPLSWVKYLENTFFEQSSEAFNTLIEKNLIKMRSDLGAGLWFSIEDRELVLSVESNTEVESELFVQILEELLKENILLEVGSDHLFILSENILELELPMKQSVQDLLFLAIQKARAEGAFESASKYFKPIIEHFLTNDLKPDDETWGYFLDYLLILNHAGNFETFDIYYPKINAKSRNNTDEMRLANLRCIYLMYQDRFKEALELGLSVLRRQGVKISSNPKTFHIILALIKLERAIKKRDLSDIESMPRIKDPEQLAMVLLMRIVGSAVFLTAPKLIPEVFSTQIRLSLKFGLDDGIGIAFASYGFILASFTGRVERGIEMAEFSETLNKVLDDPPSRCVTTFISNLFVEHWRFPLSKIVERLNRNYQYSMQNGNLNMAFFSLAGATVYDFFSGQYIPQLKAMAMERLQFVADHENSPTKDMFEIVIQACHDLDGGNSSEGILSGEYFNLKEKRQELIETTNYSSLMIAITIRDITRYLKGDHASNVDDEKFFLFASKTLGESTYTHALGQFLVCLFAAKEHGKLRGPSKKIFGQIRKKNRFAHIKLREEVIGAVVDARSGKEGDALYKLNLVIEEAKTQGAFLEQLIAWKERYVILEKTGQKSLATEASATIVNILRKWGAKSITSDVLTDYKSNEFDFSALIRATNSLSTEMDVKELVQKLFSLIRSQLPKADIFLVDREQSLCWDFSRKNEKPVLMRLEERDFPRVILAEEQEDGKVFSVEDPQSHSNFKEDPYFESYAPGSIAYSKISGKWSVLGTLYIESDNNVLTDHTVLDVIQLIVSQARIALEKVNLDKNYQIAQSEKKVSEDLLLNILPEKTALELKEKGKVAAKFYEDVTIMLADIKGFTTLSERLSPQELIETIDFLYKGFDDIIDTLGLEKIKTIGDAYLAVGGMPEGNSADPERVVEAAVKIQNFMKLNKERNDLLELRIGIHSGPVIAGVVGSKKYQYDIWGDSVNVAARMEQASEPGMINISEATYQKVRQKVSCSPRGKISSKNKGLLDMYYVSF